MIKLPITKFRYAGLLTGNPTIQEIEFNGGLTTQLVNDSVKQEMPEEWIKEDYEDKHINPKWISINAMPQWMKVVFQERWGIKLIHDTPYKKPEGTLIKILSIDEVNKLLENVTYRGNKKKPRIQIDDMDISARRMVHHIGIGTDCVACNRKGKQYELWKYANGSLHLDLFSEDDMLMTIDHIKPKALEGSDQTKNFQMMCYECNQAKACS